MDPALRARVVATLAVVAQDVARGFGRVENSAATRGRELPAALARLDPWERGVVHRAAGVAGLTANQTGDGSATTWLLMHAIADGAAQRLDARADAAQLKRGIDRAVEEAACLVDARASRVTDATRLVGLVERAGRVSPALASAIARAGLQVGAEGLVVIGDARPGAAESRSILGLELDRGWLSPFFITDAFGRKAMLDRPLVWVVDCELRSHAEVAPMFELARRAGRSLLLIAGDVGADALAACVFHRLSREAPPACAIKAPEFGRERSTVIGDVACFIGTPAGLPAFPRELAGLPTKAFGELDRAVVGRDTTLLLGGRGQPEVLQARLREIRAASASTSNDYDRGKLARRAAMLSRAYALVEPSSDDMPSGQGAMDADGLRVARAAVASGVVVGGGVEWAHVAGALRKLAAKGDERHGIETVARAIEEPFRCMVRGAGLDVEDTLKKIRADRQRTLGVHVATGRIESLAAAQVFDTAQTLRRALELGAHWGWLFATDDRIVGGAPPA